MDKVAIGIPAYRNPEVLRWVLESVLQQPHDDIRIFVFDNCFAESFDEVKKLILEIDDERITYTANEKNIGPRENYKRCFEAISNYSYGMVLSADYGLAPEALEILSNEIKRSSVDIAYPDVLLAKSLVTVPELTSSKNLASDKGAIRGVELLSSSEQIAEFFGPLNFGGEYTRFCFVGALAKGHLFRGLSGIHSPYRFHGWEFQMSILLASRAKDIALVHQPLLVSITGLPKSSQTVRPATDWTRLEPILATYETVQGLAKKGLGKSFELGRAEIRKRHLDLLDHYLSEYGQHRIVAWVAKGVLSLGISSPFALGAVFSLLARFRSKRLSFLGAVGRGEKPPTSEW